MRRSTRLSLSLHLGVPWFRSSEYRGANLRMKSPWKLSAGNPWINERHLDRATFYFVEFMTSNPLRRTQHSRTIESLGLSTPTHFAFNTLNQA
jgi:hypothetical protein